MVQQDLQLVRAEHEWMIKINSWFSNFTCVCGLTELEQSLDIVSEEPVDRVGWMRLSVKFFVHVSLITVSVWLWIWNLRNSCEKVLNSECARFLTNIKSLENTLRQLSLNYSQSNHRGELSNNSSNYFQPFLTFSFPKEYISQIAAVRSHLELIGPISFLCEAETRT